ncbi:c-type cytochrome [Photobacterium chitinilyticum]|uniref:Cytochrome c n=1 Tax=Photobacterium chitinilyticum TaxID=2485123 RepID=A0A444JRB2_9GAMM|nr:cytochrome c [Photobacterium chitinilyticum]RWX55570.1 cytochrome c [Photobacterium chitinilyticum]
MIRAIFWMKWLSILCLLCVWSANVYSAKLVFSEEGEVVKELTLGVMKKQLLTHQVSIYDPQYGKDKRYLAFSLHDVMALAYGKSWEGKLCTDVKFAALDGYQAVSSFDKLLEQGGYIVYRDADLPGWELIGRSQSNPGPFYLVWTGSKQTPKQAFPWPYQLAAVDTVEFKNQYPALYPHSVKETTSVFAGFRLFKDRCMKCHALDQQGGKVGPDLNAPRSILSYRDADTLREYIRQPSKFRYTQMPDHTDLSFQQIDSILEYLAYQGKSAKN